MTKQETQSAVVERDVPHLPERKWRARAVTVARAFAILRGVMLVLSCVVLIFAPEKALPGSSTEPARSLALMFASRTILLGGLLVVLAIARKREGLGWLLLADAALQIFDVGLAIAMEKGALAIAPAALGAMDVWAGLVLLRAARSSPVSPARVR